MGKYQILNCIQNLKYKKFIFVITLFVVFLCVAKVNYKDKNRLSTKVSHALDAVSLQKLINSNKFTNLMLIADIPYDARIQDSVIDNVYINRTGILDSISKNVIIKNSTIQYSRFSVVEFENVTFKNVNFIKVRFRDAKFKNVTFINCYLSKVRIYSEHNANITFINSDAREIYIKSKTLNVNFKHSTVMGELYNRIKYAGSSLDLHQGWCNIAANKFEDVIINDLMFCDIGLNGYAKNVYINNSKELELRAPAFGDVLTIKNTTLYNDLHFLKFSNINTVNFVNTRSVDEFGRFVRSRGLQVGKIKNFNIKNSEYIHLNFKDADIDNLSIDKLSIKKMNFTNAKINNLHLKDITVKYEYPIDGLKVSNLTMEGNNKILPTKQKSAKGAVIDKARMYVAGNTNTYTEKTDVQGDDVLTLMASG